MNKSIMHWRANTEDMISDRNSLLIDEMHGKWGGTV